MEVNGNIQEIISTFMEVIKIGRQFRPEFRQEFRLQIYLTFFKNYLKIKRITDYIRQQWTTQTVKYIN